MTTQISSPCITTTDICNGSYGCGTDTEMAVLARVVPVWEKDEWSIGKAYGPLSVVKAPGTDTLYISKVPVPCGIELGDCKYWSVYNDNRVASEAKEIAEAARQEAEEAVQVSQAATRAVVSEASIREQADDAIRELVNAEQSARETADEQLTNEVNRVSGNADALSKRVDELEQNGGGGIAYLEARMTAAETVNTQQGTEIEAIQAQLATVNEDMDSMGEQLHGMVEQVGTNSNELDQLIVPGTGTEAGTWKAGPELEKWLGESGGSIQTPVSLTDGGTGADNQKDAANNLLVRDYANASMDGQDAWNHGNFVVGNVDTVKYPGNYLLPPSGGNKFVIAQLTGEQEGSTAASGNPVMQMASNANGMFYTRFFPTGVSTNSNDNWVRLAASAEVDAIKSENQEQSTSIAKMETELRQLIVANPDTQQFEKGPKMEEWTSGGGGITVNEIIVERSYVSASSNSFTLSETLEKFDIENVKFLGVTFYFEVPGIKQKYRINTLSSEGSWSPGQKTIYALANTIVDMHGESFKNIVGNPLGFPIGITFYTDDSNFSKVFNWQGQIMFTAGNLNNTLIFKMHPVMSFIGTPNLNSILQLYFDGSVTCKIRIKFIS